MRTDVGWTAQQWPGMEHVIVSQEAGGGSRAVSRLIMADERLATVEYELVCASRWRFTELTISVTDAAGARSLTLARTPEGRWLADGQPRPDLDGCADIDINRTPLTNTLPIRRLDWSPGRGRDLDVTYVTVPDLTVGKVQQRYTLLTPDAALARRDGHAGRSPQPEAGSDYPVFRYEAGSFRADLQVDDDGLVLDYPGLWRRVCDDRQVIK
jgi:hypothetical protein